MKYILIILLAFFSACTRTYHHEPSKITAGIVQREIYIGMPAPDVATILGAPNIVSLDIDKNEVWIYDKVSTQIEYNSQSNGVWLLIAGGGSESGCSKKSQRTLTIIIKFDCNKQVRDFTYHSSSF